MKKIQRRFALAGIASLSVFGLMACGSKVLDYRNAQISNGQIFEDNTNSAFSGQLTNVPGRQIVVSQGAATRVMGFVRMSNGDSGSLYTTLCDVTVKNGYLDGKATCKDPYKGVVRYQMSFNEGVLQGDFTMYAPNGDDPMVKAAFDNGRPDGEEKTYDGASGKLVADLHWDHGIVKGKVEQFDADTGDKILETSKDEQGLDDGDYVQYTPDGTIIHKAHYEHGKKSGPEETFDHVSGKPLSHIDWQDDRINGAYRKWDANGNLIQDDAYENGNRILTPAEQQAASDAAVQMDYADCMKKWQRAGMAIQMHTMSPDEEVKQWQASCKQGVLPG